MDKLARFCKAIKRDNPKLVNFDNIDIDENIKDFIKIINKSKYIYTLYSCSGHKTKYRNKPKISSPYFVWIVDKKKLNYFNNKIINLLPNDNTYNGQFIFSGSYKVSIELNYNNNDYQIVTTHFDQKCTDNNLFYNNLIDMAKEIYYMSHKKNYIEKTNQEIIENE